MPDKQNEPRQPLEYRFEIDSFTPETIPLSRLAQYLGDLARMMGENSNVHLVRVDKGSTVPIIRVDWEAQPKVEERLRLAPFNEGPLEPRRAYREINRKLIEDNAAGALFDPSAKRLIRFPGRDGANQPEFGPISQPGAFQGIPIKLGGEKDSVPVHLEDGAEIHIVQAPRRIAKEIAPYLFSNIVRVEGKGRWLRNKTGEWEMLHFHVSSFEVLSDGDLLSNVAALRAIPGEWKSSDDPLGDLAELRTGERPQ